MDDRTVWLGVGPYCVKFSLTHNAFSCPSGLTDQVMERCASEWVCGCEESGKLRWPWGPSHYAPLFILLSPPSDLPSSYHTKTAGSWVPVPRSFPFIFLFFSPSGPAASWLQSLGKSPQGWCAGPSDVQAPPLYSTCSNPYEFMQIHTHTHTNPAWS